MSQIKNEIYWENKLLAFLHDPPHKPYGITNHEQTLFSNLNLFGLTPDDFDKEEKFRADSMAAAADRFIFPNPRKSYKGSPLRTNWQTEGLPFIHPFCGTKLKPHEYPITKEVAENWMSSALSKTIRTQKASQNNFLKAWRLWEKNLVNDGKGSSAYFPFLVADTRIPDHTIWQHNALVSALTSSGKTPAFLIFQLGPVQSFIAQAQSTRDLWAGSYILSFLNARAMYHIAKKYGPDHIIFPQLKGNPILDHFFWETYGDDLAFTKEAFEQWKTNQLLIPSLPNRFLAIIPASDVDIQEELKNVVKETWEAISSSVHDFMNNIISTDATLSSFKNWDELWEEQISQFPRVDCFIKPFEDNQSVLDDFIKQGMPPYDPQTDHPTVSALKWAKDDLFKAGGSSHKFYDNRNYQNSYDSSTRRSVLQDEQERKLNSSEKAIVTNPGSIWALQYMKTEWQFGAIRANRIFHSRFSFAKNKESGIPGLQDPKRFIEKDHLDGVNEVLGGQQYKQFWEAISRNDELNNLFRTQQRYGALSIIKRLFAKAYLSLPEVYNFDVHKKMQIKSTHEIASGKRDDTTLSDSDCKYYAIICLDGDDMGKWLSGANAQPLAEQLSGNGIQTFFTDHSHAKEMKRAVSPSYHATFSESLANFSNYCAEPIVSSFGGQLIYAGGDDVLAMVPASKAIDCTESLQLAFRGLKPTDKDSLVYKVMNEIFDFEWSEMNTKQHVDGFLKLRNPGSARPKSILILPGPRTTVSAGIAIGHIKSPMQDLIQAARIAEHEAKESGKDGFQLSIKKRSGETNGFFAHWNRKSEDKKWQDEAVRAYSGYLALWNKLFHEHSNLQDKSNRMPYIYSQYIAPLLKGRDGTYLKEFDEDLAQACEEFLRIVLERQTPLRKEDAIIESRRIIKRLNLKETCPKEFINFWMSYAFMNRLTAGGE